MSNPPTEFFEEFEGIPDALETQDDPAVETAEEYGEEVYPTDIPTPDEMLTVQDQNPGFAEGAHV